MPELTILHCDNHVLAVAKPAGLAVVPDASRDSSLFDLAREWVRVEFQKSGEAWLGVVHRLDRPVSGVVVFARTSKAAARLAASFRVGQARKIYLGVSERSPTANTGELEQWLSKDSAENRVSVCRQNEPGARLARTRWRVRARSAGLTLLELEPLTGRAHQLRVALATLGAPLAGDLKYGAAHALPDRSIALHAWRLELAHPTRAEVLRFCADPPQGEPWSTLREAWQE